MINQCLSVLSELISKYSFKFPRSCIFNLSWLQSFHYEYNVSGARERVSMPYYYTEQKHNVHPAEWNLLRAYQCLITKHSSLLNKLDSWRMFKNCFSQATHLHLQYTQCCIIRAVFYHNDHTCVKMECNWRVVWRKPGTK